MDRLSIFGVGLLAGALMVTPPALAAGGFKIGYVNAGKLVESAPQGEAALKKLEAEFSPRDRKLRDMRDNINKLENELEKNTLVMSDSNRLERERKLLEQQRKLKRTQQEVREDYNLRRNEELSRLQRIVSDAIIDIAKADDYDLIVQQAVYASKAVDITDKVLARLKKTAK